MAQAFNIYKLMDISRRTQTSGIPGAGSPLLMVGDPGLGKTAINQAYCDDINHWCEVIILGRIPSVDIGGIYAPDFKNNKLVHMITERLLGVIDAAKGYDGINVFFDEVGNSGEEQQTALISLIESRVLEGRKVPDNVWYTFASNREGTNCGSNALVRSFLDRVIKVEIRHDKDVLEDRDLGTVPYISIEKDIYPRWVEWAVNEGSVNPLITAYLKMSGENATDDSQSAFHHFDPNCAEAGQPSPRAWTKVSRAIECGAEDEEMKMVGPLRVGTATWNTFWGWVQTGQHVAQYDEIITNPHDASVPPDDKPSHSYAVICNIATGVKRAGNKLKKNEVDNILTYLRRLPETFTAYGWKLANGTNPKFADSPNTSEFTIEFGDLIR